MAEVAGLVIGGISMAALVDGCMKTFDRIESARTYGRDYQKAALRLSLLQLRLSRWIEGIIETMKQNDLTSVGTTQQAERVKLLLGHIGQEIDAATKVATRYDTNITTPGSVEPEKAIATIENLTKRVKSMAIHRQNTATLGQKTRWALRDQHGFKKLLDSLSESIVSLEVIFPPEELAYLAHAQNQLAEKDASELIQPSGIEEPIEAEVVASILEDAGSGDDKIFAEAVGKVVHVARHSYGEINTSDDVKIFVGDYVALGHRKSGPGHIYRKLTASGNSRIHYGDSFGGRVFSTTRTWRSNLYGIRVL